MARETRQCDTCGTAREILVCDNCKKEGVWRRFKEPFGSRLPLNWIMMKDGLELLIGTDDGNKVRAFFKCSDSFFCCQGCFKEFILLTLPEEHE